MVTTQQRPLLSRIRNADEPEVAFKVGGLDVLSAMDKLQAHDENTQDSGGSDLSNLSALENETDDFGRKLLQHQRDLQRLRHALAPGQQAFRRARPRSRLADRLEHDDAQNGMKNGENHVRTGSAGSNGSDPPLNIPMQWGHRARRRKDWLREQQAQEVDAAQVRNGRPGLQEQRMDSDAIIPHVTAFSGDGDWVAVADDPIPSIEHAPRSPDRHRADSSPTSMRHMNSTLRPGLDSDDQDFTAASLLASTPAVNRRDRRIDELTQREIENVERRGVTKRTLEQIFEQSVASVQEQRPVSAPSGDTARAPRRRRSLMANKENMAPNGDVNGIYKGAETVSIVNRTAQAVTFKNTQRPAHTRNDSYNLLRRIARVSSTSPSPAKYKVERDVGEKRTKSEPVIEPGPLSAKSTNSDYIASDMPPTRSAASEQSPYPTPYAEPQTDEPVEDEAAAPPEERDMPDIDVTPAPQEPPKDAKTPVVTGAWVDTPKPLADLPDIRPLLKATDSTIVRAFGTPSALAALEPPADPLNDSVRRIYSEPARAKSALADILKDAKSQTDAQYGETTIQSLEDMLDPDLDPTDPALTVDMGEVAQEFADAIDAEQLLTQAEKDRRQETLAIEAMNKHLRAARTSIKDANRGLRRVENRIEIAQEAPASSSAPTPAGIPRPPKIGKHGKTVCEACGGTYYGSVWKALWTEFRECFYTYSPPNSWRGIRFTWLGLLCLGFLTWYTVESLLCWRYCHKLYGSSMRGFGVDPDAPRFPFVIPTLLFRPVKFIWKPTLDSLAWCSSVLGNWLFGDNAVSPDPPVVKPASTMTVRKAFTNSATQRWVKTATAGIASASARVAGSLVDTLDEAGSMWDDEFI